ncbi:MAG: 3-dehydroquinate synthase, partial [Prevotella sp.]|nr:3-dehydroquinate synthase [Prevotella sp.]
MKQNLIFSEDLQRDLQSEIESASPDRLFVLTDENTRRLCWPLVEGFSVFSDARLIEIPQGDVNKNLDSLAMVWEALQRGGGTRHSLLVNLGGGMVCDLGGFAASTFKRGIRFVNIPTTLLAMVDASVGGKTGVNFGGLKNEIGTFSEPQAVVIDTKFLETLDRENLLSGYAEMLKHGLLDTVEHWAEVVKVHRSKFIVHSSKSNVQCSMFNVQCSILERSIAVKQRIVASDPHEKGLRKALNLGHTFGHAFESFSIQHPTPILHGHAVAFGLICE